MTINYKWTSKEKYDDIDILNESKRTPLFVFEEKRSSSKRNTTPLVTVDLEHTNYGVVTSNSAYGTGGYCYLC